MIEPEVVRASIDKIKQCDAKVSSLTNYIKESYEGALDAVNGGSDNEWANGAITTIEHLIEFIRAMDTEVITVKEPLSQEDIDKFNKLTQRCIND